MGHLNKAMLAFAISCLLFSGCASVGSTLSSWYDGAKTSLKPNKKEIEDKPADVEIATKVDKDIFQSDDSESEEFLKYYQEIATLSISGKHRQLEQAEKNYKENKAVRSGLLLVLTLLASEQNQQNLKLALNVLEEVQSLELKKKSAPELTAFMHLIWDMLRVNAELVEEQAQMSSRLGEQKQRLVLLQKQINALKSIEKSIHEREVGIVTENR